MKMPCVPTDRIKTDLILAQAALVLVLVLAFLGCKDNDGDSVAKEPEFNPTTEELIDYVRLHASSNDDVAEKIAVDMFAQAASREHGISIEEARRRIKLLGGIVYEDIDDAQIAGTGNTITIRRILLLGRDNKCTITEKWHYLEGDPADRNNWKQDKAEVK